MRLIRNSVRRKCVKCGYVVRVNEGKLDSKSVSGEWKVSHLDGECQITNPTIVFEKNKVEQMHPDVQRKTPVSGSRIYSIKNHGDYESVTSILEMFNACDPSPAFGMWQAVEAATTGLENVDLYESDYKNWKKEVRAATNVIAQEAAYFGTIVHDCIMDIIDIRVKQKKESIDLDIETIIDFHVPDEEHMREQYMERVRVHIQNFLEWEKQWVRSWYGSELIIWNETEGWAGQGDAYGLIAKAKFSGSRWVPTDEFVPTMVDWKTSKIKDKKFRDSPEYFTKPSYRLQVVAYARGEYTFNNEGKLVSFSDRKPIEQAMVGHVRLDDLQVEPVFKEKFEEYGEVFKHLIAMKKHSVQVKNIMEL